METIQHVESHGNPGPVEQPWRCQIGNTLCDSGSIITFGKNSEPVFAECQCSKIARIREAYPAEIRGSKIDPVVVRLLNENVSKFFGAGGDLKGAVRIVATRGELGSLVKAFCSSFLGWNKHQIASGDCFDPRPGIVGYVELRQISNDRERLANDRKSTKDDPVDLTYLGPKLLIINMGTAAAWGKTVLLDIIEGRSKERGKTTWLVSHPEVPFDASNKAWCREFEVVMQNMCVDTLEVSKPAEPEKKPKPDGEKAPKPSAKPKVVEKNGREIPLIDPDKITWRQSTYPNKRCISCGHVVPKDGDFTWNPKNRNGEMICRGCVEVNWISGS